MPIAIPPPRTQLHRTPPKPHAWQYSLWALASLGWLAAGCAPKLQPGHFSCAADADCPDRWQCVSDIESGKHCYPPDGKRSSGISPGDGGDPRADAQPDSANPPERDASHLAPTEPLPDAARPADGATETDSASTHDASEPIEPPPTPDCQPDPADPARGIFVSPPPIGSAAVNCGSAAAPCSSIQLGMARAKDAQRSLVYLDSGTYAETVTLLAGLTLQGGWNNVGGAWTRQCSGNRAASARISASSEVGVRADYEGSASLESLSIDTLPSAATGQSLYGIFARGSGTKLRLNDVRVRAAAGGAGTQGASAITPTTPSGGCAEPGDGTNGVPDGAPGSGAPTGTFDRTGYVASAGVAGDRGVAGKNGTLSAPSCINCLDACDVSTCSGSPIGQSCGLPGNAGCGGAAAAGSGGGGGGGSSVAIFVWAAEVTVEGGRLESGDGGPGAAGGPAAAGGTGSDGLPGTNGGSCAVCRKSLVIDPPIELSAEPVDTDKVIIPPPSKCISGTSAGIGGRAGKGGSGSAGGPGGGGAGGHSYGAYAGGAAKLTLSNTTQTKIGKPGKSLGNGAHGEAADLRINN